MGGGLEVFCFWYIHAFDPRPSSTVSFSLSSPMRYCYLYVVLRTVTSMIVLFIIYPIFFLIFFFFYTTTRTFHLPSSSFFLQCVNLSHFENLFIEVSSKMTLINFIFFFRFLERQPDPSWEEGRLSFLVSIPEHSFCKVFTAPAQHKESPTTTHSGSEISLERDESGLR